MGRLVLDLFAVATFHAPVGAVTPTSGASSGCSYLPLPRHDATKWRDGRCQ